MADIWKKKVHHPYRQVNGWGHSVLQMGFLHISCFHMDAISRRSVLFKTHRFSKMYFRSQILGMLCYIKTTCTRIDFHRYYKYSFFLKRYFFCGSFMFLFCLVFAMSLCASVYMCFVVTCLERADLLALVCGV